MQAAWKMDAGNLFQKIHSNRREIKSNGATLVYIRRLSNGTAKTQTASAMQELLALRLTLDTREAVLEFILRYLEQRTRYLPRLEVINGMGFVGAPGCPVNSRLGGRRAYRRSHLRGVRRDYPSRR